MKTMSFCKSLKPVDVDIEAEQQKIVQYQKETDPNRKAEILNELYEERITTIKHWTKSYSQEDTQEDTQDDTQEDTQDGIAGILRITGITKEDLFQEFSMMFIKSCDKYDPERLVHVLEKGEDGEYTKTGEMKTVSFNAVLMTTLLYKANDLARKNRRIG